MVTIAILFIIITLLTGWSVVVAFRFSDEITESITLGSILGFAVSIFTAYVLSLLGGISPVSLIIITAANLAITTWIWQSQQRRYLLRELHWDKTASLLGIIMLIAATFIAPKLLSFHNGSLSTSVFNNYGDIAWHASIITSFAEQRVPIPSNPSLAGHPLIYPFLNDFGSALLILAGASLPASVVIPALLLLPCLFLLLYFLTKELTGSKLAAVFAVLIFLFSGGTLGWTRFADDWKASQDSSLTSISESPRHYYTGATNDKDGFNFINPLIGLILPQRAILLGMPLALAMLLLLVKAKPADKYFYIAAGVIAGILPLTHAHTVLAMIPIILGLMIVKPVKQWGYFVATAAILGLPQVLFYLSSGSSSFSFAWQLGWMKPDNMSWVTYWFKNSGLLIPLAIIGLWWPDKNNTKLHGITIASLFIFAIANLWLFAKWDWDNTKVLIYWILLSAPATGYVCALLYRQKHAILKAAAIFLVGMQCLAGALDVSLLFLSQEYYDVWNNYQIKLAQDIIASTEPNAIFLTAPRHNSGIELSGRARYLGYPGHVWSHGYDYQSRESTAAAIYQNAPMNTPQPPINYVLVGLAEKADYPQLVIPSSWKKIIEEGPYAVYKITDTLSR